MIKFKIYPLLPSSGLGHTTMTDTSSQIIRIYPGFWIYKFTLTIPQINHFYIKNSRSR